MQDRWSRYIGAMGIEAVKKQSESKVLLIGLKSLGLEIAKNLVLSGLKQLTIVEKEKLIKGSEEHFYMSDLKGKNISECLFKIKELNPYMLVNHSSEIPQL
jgi:molybdopterin/thiamine biosynthesis adenylyltransferase